MPRPTPPFQGGQGMSTTHIQLGVRLGWPGGLHHPHLVRWIFPLKLTGGDYPTHMLGFVIVDQFLDPETVIKLQFLDPDTDKKNTIFFTKKL